jgi:hypothetical protein
MPAEQAEHGAGGLWLTITELAELKGVGKSTISEQVAALVAAGKVTLRPGKGRAKLVNVAAFDVGRGQVADPAKELAAETRLLPIEPEAPGTAPGATPSGGAYRDAQTRKTQYEADLREIELKEKLGELVPVAEVAAAANGAAEAIVRVIDRISSHAEAIAAAVGKDGPAGARAKLKEISIGLRSEVEAAMLAIATPPAQEGAETPPRAPDAAEQAPTML